MSLTDECFHHSFFHGQRPKVAEERRFQGREILTAQRTVSASDLCDRLKVTAATIRRDLAALEQEGVSVRSHGGAVSRMSSTNFQPTYDALLRSESEEVGRSPALQNNSFSMETPFFLKAAQRFLN